MNKLITTVLICLFLTVPAVLADDPMPGHMVRPYSGPATPDVIRPERSDLLSSAPAAASQEIIDLIEQVDVNLVRGYLEDLVDFGPRVTGSQACEDATDYIYDQFSSMGLDVRYCPWFNYGYQGRNVQGPWRSSDHDPLLLGFDK